MLELRVLANWIWNQKRVQYKEYKVNGTIFITNR